MRKQNYPIGSVISGTMRPEDLIPAFADELERQIKHGPAQSRDTRCAHKKLLREVHRLSRLPAVPSDDTDWLLSELFDALECYAAPYFYFGAHPGDGADYGFWLTDDVQNDFDGLEVSDLSEVPTKYRGEVLLTNDHGNVSLYVKSTRALREIWAVV